MYIHTLTHCTHTFTHTSCLSIYTTYTYACSYTHSRTAHMHSHSHHVLQYTLPLSTKSNTMKQMPPKIIVNQIDAAVALQKSPIFPQKSPTFPQKILTLPHSCRYVNRIHKTQTNTERSHWQEKSSQFHQFKKQMGRQ